MIFTVVLITRSFHCHVTDGSKLLFAKRTPKPPFGLDAKQAIALNDRLNFVGELYKPE